MVMTASEKKSNMQDPHGLAGERDNRLEIAIGNEVRQFRRQQNMTVAELAKGAGVSTGMLSKIENGITSPSLASLQALSKALQVPVTTFFRRFEDAKEATFVKSGEGLKIERRGTRAGHQYELLGHSTGKNVAMEPYLITLSEKSDVFPLFQHEGIEVIYMLKGKVTYQHGDNLYDLEPGDSLYFDGDVPHGPESLTDLPIQFLSVISYKHQDSSD